MVFDQSLFESVCDHARRAMLLQSTADTLEWDERTGLPVAAGPYRAEQISNLRAMTHDQRVDPRYGDQLRQLKEQIAGENPHSDVAATIGHLLRDHQRDCKLPSELVEQISRTTVRGQQAWDTARAADDFSLFRDTLQNIVELQREAGRRLAEGTDGSPYEALLEEYEPGARVQPLQEVFGAIRGPLVDLIAEIRDAPRQPPIDVLKQAFPLERQRDFSRRVARQVGFDFDRGRLDETSHPFCTTLGPSDIRILTRYDVNWMAGGLFGTLHEAGHGMYEQGLRQRWYGLPPGSCLSLGVHESQSRLWENQVGRSRPFWEGMYPHAQAAFAPVLDDVPLDDFHFAVNAIQPSLIRVEADEATYNLHIIIRFDLERQLIEGSLSVDDLPEAWDERYQQDLGIRPPSAADGVLQDVHWSAGLFGYFPTYTLGNLIGAQLFDAASETLGNLPAMLSRGEFSPLLQWLQENVHRHGRCYTSAELVERATGSPLSADHLLNYLRGKLGPLYGLKS